MANKARLISLTRKLISIDSQNPPGNEKALAGFIKGYLQTLGLTVKIVEFRKNRPNLLCTLAGRNRRRSLLITPHLDTVPAGKHWRFDPFRGAIRGNKLYGLGATDCKGNLACALEAINSLVEKNEVLDYNLVFAATADEESGSYYGLIPLLQKGILKPDAAVVLDADDFQIIVEQKGLLHVKVALQGKRAHGAYPWMGVNAIDLAVKILAEMNAQKFPFRKNPYLKPATLNIGTIRGGDKVNIVADWCEFELDYRYLPGMRAEDFLTRLRRVLKKHAARFHLTIDGIQRPYSIPRTHPLVTCLSQAMRKCQVRPSIEGSEGATVITFFQEKKIPAIATGFGSDGCAHTANEFARIKNLYRGAQLLEEFLKNFTFT
jgi:succinyl-diaminopimelate desuccinylase